jgi:hypothetical protein
MHNVHFGHLWRAYRKARDSAEHYDRAPCTIQALVTGMRFFQWDLTWPFTVDARQDSTHKMTEHLDLREGSPKLLEHFAVMRYEKL